MNATFTSPKKFLHFFEGTLFLMLVIGLPICLKAADYLNNRSSSPPFFETFSTITWGTAASQPFSVSEAQGEVVNGKLYSFGGFDSQKSCCTPTSRAYVYDPALNNWTSLASMPPMNGTSYGGVTHAGFANDGVNIYFAGGYTSNSTGTGQIFGTREAWKYIISENRYVRLPDLPIVISAGQLEFLNGKLHHIGGTNSSRTTDLGNHYVLDLNNLTAGWTTAATLPSPRQHSGSAVYNNQIYYIGGQTGHDANLTTSKLVHRYSETSNSWTQVADLPVPSGTIGRGHISSSVIVYDERIIVLGGETANNSVTSMVSAYSPSTNTWENLTSLPAGRRSGVAGVLNSNIYYSGGGTSVTYKGIPLISATAAACPPESTLSCDLITVGLPFNLDFNAAKSNSLTDKNNQGTGFTMADAYSGTRNSADGTPGNSSVPGYEASKLTLGGGRLQILSNKGIAYLTSNNQVNALGVRFSSVNKYQVETVLINPYNGSSAQQGGIWIGQNDKTFIKLVAVGNKLEFRKEVNDVSGSADARVTSIITGLNTRTVNLRVVIDPATAIAEAFYSIDGTNFINVGAAYSVKGLSISGMSLTGSTAFAGIYATHRNSSTPVTYIFDNFSVSGTASTTTACSPTSTLPCSAIQVSLPLNLTFNAAVSNTLNDKNNLGTGFTMVDAYSGTRNSADGTPSNSSVRGYEASKLTLGSGRLQILSNKGIAYLTNNNQLNALGVQFSSVNKYQVETVLINPYYGTSAQQGGIWIGQNDKTFLKLVAVGNKLEFRKEVNDVSGTADARTTAVISGLNTLTVNLRIVIDPATAMATAFYSTDGTSFLSVGSGLSISGMALTGSTAFAGIYATHRNSSTPVTYTFDNFSVSGSTTDPEPQPVTACSPTSTLPCTAVQVSLPLNLTFNAALSNTMTDKNNQGTGFTMVDAYSGTRNSVDGTPSNSSVRGYEASKLTLGSGRLQILSNKGIAYLTNNNQLNALGVKFSSVSKYQVETVLINPYYGTSAQQGGIWIGQNDKTFIKLVAVGNKLEFRKEVNDVSGTADVRTTAVISGLNTLTVNLRVVIDPANAMANAFYSTDGTNFLSVGSGLSISGMALTGSTTFAGIYATHRNSSTPVTYTFDNFSITAPTNQPPPPPPPPASINPGAYMVIENRDQNFPAPDHLVFSRIQNPWDGADNVSVNYNHDKVTLRIHNKGTSALTVNSLSISKSSLSVAWKIAQINSDVTASLPISIAARGFADVVIAFIAVDEATRVKTIHDTLYISSGDPTFPLKKIMLHGNFQLKGEGGNEPRAQEILNTFAFKTRTGFTSSDGSTNRGTVIVPNSEEVIPSFFVRADPVRPVTVTQMAAYHTCCNTRESFQWYVKGSTTNTTLFSHYAADGQSHLPRLNNTTATTNPVLARGSFNPTGAFGIRSGTAYSDRTRNFEQKIGMRIWKAIDASGNIIPNAYIIGTDYLGTSFTNYDYQDNIYFIENVRPETGTAYYSLLSAQPSAVSFSNVNTGSSGSIAATIKNMGTSYSNGSSDPSIVIQRIQVVGQHASEFSASMPPVTTLGIQANTGVPVRFAPTSPGIKNAALLVYYNNSKSPLRIPLYGISNSSSTTVSNTRRIKSNASVSVAIGGQTWEADINYRIGNVKLDTQTPKSDVAGTDIDVLYQTYLSSNANFDEIRYEIPLANGNYMIRMHHVENVWQASGLRVFNVSIENQLKLPFLDIFKEVGYRAALVKDYETTVTDGVLSIKFNPSSDRLAIAGLEIFTVTGSQTLSAQSSNIFSINEPADVLTPGTQIMRTYPNPNAGDRLFVDLLNFGVRENVTIQMHDILGRLIKSVKAMTDEQGRLSTELTLGMPLNKEIYIIRASSPSGIKQSKIIVE